MLICHLRSGAVFSPARRLARQAVRAGAKAHGCGVQTCVHGAGSFQVRVRNRGQSMPPRLFRSVVHRMPVHRLVARKSRTSRGVPALPGLSRVRRDLSHARDGPSSPQSRQVNRNADKVDGIRREMLTTTIRAGERAAVGAIVVYQDRRLCPPPTGCACRGLVSTFQILEPGSCALVRHACPCASVRVRAHSARAAIMMRSASSNSASVKS